MTLMNPVLAEIHNAHRERRARFFAPRRSLPRPEVRLEDRSPVVEAPLPAAAVEESFLPPVHKTKVVTGKFPPIALIMAAVARAAGITVDDIKGERRFPKHARARQVSMYLAVEITPFSSPEIGRRLGGRDHATVLHAHRKIASCRDEPSIVEMIALAEADIAERFQKIEVPVATAAKEETGKAEVGRKRIAWTPQLEAHVLARRMAGAAVKTIVAELGPLATYDAVYRRLYLMRKRQEGARA